VGSKNLLIRQRIMGARAAARSDPATHIPALVRLVHAHLMLAAGWTAMRRIKTPLAESLLVFVTKFKRLITLHAIKCLVVHYFSSGRFGCMPQLTVKLSKSSMRLGYLFSPALRYQATALQLIHAHLAMKMPIRPAFFFI
jgi:hypothetical protein